MKLYYNLGKIMFEKGISTRELEKKSGVSKSEINYIANNKIHPTLYNLILLSDALEVSVEELYTVFY